MRYVNIPGLDRPISILGLGAGTGAFTPERYDAAAELLETFLDAGGNCVDTAHVYGLGNSEKTLGRWFEESRRRHEVVLVTKGCHPGFDPDDVFGKPWVDRVTPEAIRSDLGESLERLQTDRVDLYLLHRDDETVEPGPLLETLNEEQARGRIGAFGASNWSVERITEANEYATQHGVNGFVVSSPGLSLPRPVKMHFPGTMFADDETRRWHSAHQFPLLAWASLAAGFASGRSRPGDPTVGDITRAYFSEENYERMRRAEEVGSGKDATGLQVALAFVLHQPFPVIALIGPSTTPNLNGALGALDVELTSEEMDFLDLVI